jgi:hypothetical protein
VPYRVARVVGLPLWHCSEKNVLHALGPLADGAYVHLTSGKWQRVWHVSRVRRGGGWVDTWEQKCNAPPPLRFGLGPMFAPLLAFASATYFAGTNDAYLYLSNTVYATAHDAGAGGITDKSTIIFIGQTYVAPDYSLYRAMIPVDTSGLPDDAILLGGVVGLYGDADLSATDFDLTVVEFTGSNPIVSEDYHHFGATSWGSLSTAGGFSITGYNSITLNATGLAAISKTGVTLLGLRSSREIVGTVPTQSERVVVKSADNSGTDMDPKLDITYATPVYKVLTETLGLTEGTVRRRNMVRVLTETLGLTEGTVRRRNMVRVLTETLGLTEGTVRRRNMVRVLTETLGLTESLRRVKRRITIWTAIAKGTPSGSTVAKGSPGGSAIPKGSTIWTERAKGSPSGSLVSKGAPSGAVIPKGAPSGAVIPKGAPSGFQITKGVSVWTEIPKGTPLGSVTPKGVTAWTERPKDDPDWEGS